MLSIVREPVRRPLLLAARVTVVVLTGSGVACVADSITGEGTLEIPEPVTVSSGGATVEAAPGETSPCLEHDPGSGCSGHHYPLKAREALPVTPGRVLNVETREPADLVTAYVGRYRRGTGQPRDRGGRRGRFTEVPVDGPFDMDRRRWTIRINTVPRGVNRLNLQVDFASGPFRNGNFEARLCRAPC